MYQAEGRIGSQQAVSVVLYGTTCPDRLLQSGQWDRDMFLNDLELLKYSNEDMFSGVRGGTGVRPRHLSWG